MDHTFGGPHIHIGVAVYQHRFTHGTIRYNPDNDLIDGRFTLLVISGVAHECQMVANHPFFHEIRAIAKRFMGAFPL